MPARALCAIDADRLQHSAGSTPKLAMPNPGLCEKYNADVRGYAMPASQHENRWFATQIAPENALNRQKRVCITILPNREHVRGYVETRVMRNKTGLTFIVSGSCVEWLA